jgi:SIR2-like domain
MAFGAENIPPELISDYLGGKCGFFVGAGLSRGSGLPDWKGLLVDFIDRAKKSLLLDADRAADCLKLADDPSKYLMLAEEMKEVLGVDFKTVIEEVFTDPKVKPRTVHELLVKLGHKMFILTTNYDMLIETAFVNERTRPRVYKYYEAHAIQRSLFKREFFVLKAHGDAETAAEKVILTERDYRNILYREPGYQSALQSIFTMYSVVFLGTSLDDPELKLLLNYVNSAFPQGGIPHYALMSAVTMGATEQARWKKDYNIRIIPISAANNYSDIDDFLKLLLEKEKEAAVPS